MSEPPAADRMLAALADGPHEVFADLGGQGEALALAAALKWDCAVDLVDLDRKGEFAAASSAAARAYVARLVAAGLAADRVRIVSAAKDLRPADLIANIGLFGDGVRIKRLEAVLPVLAHADSRMISDIRKGSGAFPFLNERGECDILGRWSDEKGEHARVLFRPTAATAGGANADWARIAGELAGADGFYREGGEHSFLFVPRGDTLVVTFDNLDLAMGKRDDRRPWGYAFIEKQGWSMLGVMANGWTWYRDPWVIAEFARLRDDGFFARFARVVFYGASMGGYAAAAFSGFAPGADVVAISPQSTLDRTLVPWETRYKTAWGRDFGGPCGDAAEVSGAASRVMVLYDPHEPLDRGHAERFTGANVVPLRAPMLGHRLGSSLSQMGILSAVVTDALSGRLDPLAFHRRLRVRHTFPRYQKELFQRALDRGRPDLARRVARWVLARGDNAYIRRWLADAGGLTGQAGPEDDGAKERRR